ncbi:uncharacterized protein LOC110025794 isoform X2 [Phalaenopsis equestris]|uniref:uncharacterized protein LOC110025794 isoform X2 n=1 Tax=Phalaenopsis equestris TaxID=78828 RepID=UPI0009E2601C|nr:uncharacterized protein LOC110025794 isoform X2 [Phalaenopsis equestris]
MTPLSAIWEFSHTSEEQQYTSPSLFPNPNFGIPAGIRYDKTPAAISPSNSKAKHNKDGNRRLLRSTPPAQGRPRPVGEQDVCHSFSRLWFSPRSTDARQGESLQRIG